MLPTIDTPTFDITLPLTKKKIKYRPFLVKEQKLFMMAAESDDVNEMLNCVMQVINNCVMSNNFSANRLPIADLEYLFLNLRAKSIGEVVDLRFKCNNTVTDENGNEKVCGFVNEISVDLSKVTIPEQPKEKTRITIKGDVGIQMCYPDVKSTEGLLTDEEDTAHNGIAKDFIEMFYRCMDYVYDQDSIHYVKDEKREEVMEWIETLPQEVFKRVEEFFASAPILSHKMHFKCAKCAYEEDITLEGINAFFE